jgi:hypothetical protein
MSEGTTGGPPDLQQLARDWIELWESELTALASDREAREAWQAILSLWAGAAMTLFNAAPSSRDRRGMRSDGSGRQADAAGTAAADAASDPRNAEIERLSRRLTALEARLAELEGQHAPRRNSGHTARKRSR